MITVEQASEISRPPVWAERAAFGRLFFNLFSVEA